MLAQTATLKRRRPRRSAGCEPCKVRRMKCSETKPHCDECLKRGAADECSYSRGQIIFQSENAFVEQSFKKLKPTKRKSSTNSIITVSPNHRDSISTVSVSPRKSPLSLVISPPVLSPATIELTAGSDSSSSPELGTLDDILVVPPKKHLANDEILPGHGYCRWSNSIEMQLYTQEARALKAFFEDFLPCEIVLGNHVSWSILLKQCLKQHPILRNITLAISRINVGGWYTNFEDARQNRLSALEHYCLALNDLQDALEDPDKAMRDDTLFAVNLFGAYELVKGNSLESLYRHFSGGLSILQMRGAKKHIKPGVTQSVAASYQAEAVRKSLENRTKTFFSEPEWIEASRHWLPLGYNKWCGTELNCLLLRLTEVNASDGYDMAAAAVLNRDMLQERRKWFPQNWSIPNTLLKNNPSYLDALTLEDSVFGKMSLSYDAPDSQQFKYTLASINFDYALLVLYHTYPSLQATPDFGYQIMVNMIQAVQYLLHDKRNHTSVIIADVFGQIIHCCHWTRSEAELDWVLHCLDVSGISIARKLGRLGKARLKESMESEDMKAKKARFGDFLERNGLDGRLSTPDESIDQLTDSEPGYRSTSLAT